MNPTLNNILEIIPQHGNTSAKWQNPNQAKNFVVWNNFELGKIKFWTLNLHCNFVDVVYRFQIISKWIRWLNVYTVTVCYCVSQSMPTYWMEGEKRRDVRVSGMLIITRQKIKRRRYSKLLLQLPFQIECSMVLSDRSIVFESNCKRQRGIKRSLVCVYV